MTRLYKNALTFVVLIAAILAPTAMFAQDIPKPEDGKALVIFMLPSIIGGLFDKAVLFDVTTEENNAIGILKSGHKFAHNVDLGKRLFMVVSENADFMSAELEAGKTYYSVVKTRYGALKSRYSLFTVRQDEFGGDKFKKWDKRTKFVETGKKSEAWAAKKAQKVQQKRERYFEKWMQKITC